MTEQFLEVSGFQPHMCVDCGAHLTKFGAVRCKECNMRKIGQLNTKKRRKRK